MRWNGALWQAVRDDGLSEVAPRRRLVESTIISDAGEEGAARDELEHDEHFRARHKHLNQVHHMPLLHELHHLCVCVCGERKRGQESR